MKNIDKDTLEKYKAAVTDLCDEYESRDFMLEWSTDTFDEDYGISRYEYLHIDKETLEARIQLEVDEMVKAKLVESVLMRMKQIPTNELKLFMKNNKKNASFQYLVIEMFQRQNEFTIKELISFLKEYANQSEQMHIKVICDRAFKRMSAIGNKMLEIAADEYIIPAVYLTKIGYICIDEDIARMDNFATFSFLTYTKGNYYAAKIGYHYESGKAYLSKYPKSASQIADVLKGNEREDNLSSKRYMS